MIYINNCTYVLFFFRILKISNRYWLLLNSFHSVVDNKWLDVVTIQMENALVNMNYTSILIWTSVRLTLYEPIEKRTCFFFVAPFVCSILFRRRNTLSVIFQFLFTFPCKDLFFHSSQFALFEQFFSETYNFNDDNFSIIFFYMHFLNYVLTSANDCNVRQFLSRIRI